MSVMAAMVLYSPHGQQFTIFAGTHAGGTVVPARKYVLDAAVGVQFSRLYRLPKKRIQHPTDRGLRCGYFVG